MGHTQTQALPLSPHSMALTFKHAGHSYTFYVPRGHTEWLLSVIQKELQPERARDMIVNVIVWKPSQPQNVPRVIQLLKERCGISSITVNCGFNWKEDCEVCSQLL